MLEGREVGGELKVDENSDVMFRELMILCRVSFALQECWIVHCQKEILLFALSCTPVFISDFTSIHSLQEQEKLRSMASTTPEGKQLYNQWIIQDNRNIVHILEDLRSCKPALDHLCELLPRLQARYYSISSSPKVVYFKYNSFKM